MSSSKLPSSTEALNGALNSNVQQGQGLMYEPRPQDYYCISSGNTWQPARAYQVPASNHSLPALYNKHIRLISWNIDVLIPFAMERMGAALNHLHQVVSSTPPNIAIIILFQEMGTSDMMQIRETLWIKERFHPTDMDGNNWPESYYGTTMLVDRRLKIDSVFRVPWHSQFGRDGLFVDIRLTNKVDPHATNDKLRVCNTHLESLVANPPIRPLQLAAASQYLSQDNVSCGIVAGDFNSIQPFDRTLHLENNLNDAYLECGGSEDSEQGYTWGYQSPLAVRKRFPCRRMDKVFYRGSIQAMDFSRIGIDVKVAEEHRKMMREAGRLEWVTDHYGVMVDFTLLGDGELSEAG